jgi:hypothetical protein
MNRHAETSWNAVNTFHELCAKKSYYNLRSNKDNCFNSRRNLRLQSSVVAICATCFNIQYFVRRTQIVGLSMDVARLSELIAIISLSRINQLIFLMETHYGKPDF